MKKIAVSFVFAAAILVGSAAQAAHTVAEACGDCVLPKGMEDLSGQEVVAEAYYSVGFLDTNLKLVSTLTTLVRVLVVHHLGATIIMEQMVAEKNVIGYTGPGPILEIRIVTDSSFQIVYQIHDQEIIEFLSIMQYGSKRWLE